ncbi:MAG TPA: branched-chain amino acid ABC transporter permease [Actinomycetota bacterium]|jgi:branched-chain amino acid transport system permease protein|nr:branched-chain amino acid ABC transporter permease [Actinomycetota bacterium]
MREVLASLERPAVRRIAAVASVAVVALLPLGANPYQEDVLTQAASYALFAVGLNVVVGLAGLLDLGYVAFWAIGAYVMAIFSGAGPLQFAHLSPWAILPLGIVFAMLAGVVLGIPVLRLRGDYLAIVTLGFGEIIRITASNLDEITRGAKGIAGIPHPELAGYEFGTSPLPYFYLTLALLLVAVFVINNLNRSRIGRAWVAIREDEIAAEAMGVNTFRMKLWAFAFGASTAGIAGVINASRTNFVSPNSFQIIVSILVLCMVVLGGMGSMIGPIVGAAAIVIIPEALRDIVPAGVRFMTFGAILVVMMIFRPGGLIPSRRVAAEQRGIGVAGHEKTGVEVAEAET